MNKMLGSKVLNELEKQMFNELEKQMFMVLTGFLDKKGTMYEWYKQDKYD